MKAPCEQDIPPDLADHVDSALEALWRGNSGPFERLLDSDEVTRLPIGELLEDVATEQARRTVGLPGESEIAGYEVISEIGRGGMGVVYEALQTSTKRTVALKVMLAGPFASRAGRRRFQREVELTARLQHPGIVRVLESGETSTGQPYYAMDYVRGVPLAEWLGAEQPDVRATLGLFIELCEAVHDAHRHGVIHRDLKPGNVLVDAEGRPHILDFGLARATDRAPADENLTAYVSLPGQVLGTLRYLSPEQAAGTSEQIDERADVYALGVMLFEALTGSLPYDTTGRPSDVARRILEEPVAFPSAVSNRVDGELETIILKALAKEKARRYQSAQKMGEDLRRYLAGEPVLAKRPSTVYALRKKLTRHRAGSLLALAVIVAGVGVLGTTVWVRHDRLAEARSRALGYQRTLETGDPTEVLGRASNVYDLYPDVPEVRLLWAQTQFRLGLREAEEDWCGRAISTLKDGLEDDSSSWLYGAL
ncbi:MAG: serine/threonine protein kinase, partial [Phycisphaerales bacterium]